MALPDPWPAPYGDAPIDAVVTLPGSKSVTNRALVLAALANGPTTITGALRSRDTDLMVDALRVLGASIETGGSCGGRDPNGAVCVVRPIGDRTDDHADRNADIDCGLAGTVMRFVPPVASLTEGSIRLDGDPRARERPMRPLIDALTELGVKIEDGGRGRLPFVVHGAGRVIGGAVTLDASSSSQLVSGLLLVAPRFDSGLTIRHEGAAIPSQPHIAMTVAMLRERGVEVDTDDTTWWRVVPGEIAAVDTTVEPDLSNAAPFLAAALVTGGVVRVPGWPRRTHQAGDALRVLLTQMGADCQFSGDGETGTLTVRGAARITGIDADLHEVGELAPVIAALCVLADGPSRLRGIAHLRGHETDRIAALAAELASVGATVVETADGLEIHPHELHVSVFETYEDHRMAQAGAVLGLAVRGLEVRNVATTAKTMPSFVELWSSLADSVPSSQPT